MRRESLIWACYGTEGVFDDRRTLAACLGHAPARAALESAEREFPTLDEFRCDECYDVNPHGLSLPPALPELLLLVRVLAAWGPEPLIRAALACARLEQQRQHDLSAECLSLREAAVRAVTEFVALPTPGHRAEAGCAAEACRDRYAAFEDQPDSEEARRVWRELGAAWCAAEAAATDFRLQEYDGPGPVAASCSWGNRNSVWPQRAAEAAAQWCSHDEVRQAITEELQMWAATGC